MKTEIHPKYQEVEISCVCGAVMKTRSTQAEIRLDICGMCHPFFTGTQKIVDTEGRVERFKKKYVVASAPKKVKAKK